MKTPVFFTGILILALLVTGCTHAGTPGPGPVSTAPVRVIVTTTSAVPAPENTTSIATIPATGKPVLQPSGTPDVNISSYIRMEKESFVPGEVASFHIYNRGPGNLQCRTQDPSYAVFAQRENGTWNKQSITLIQSNRTEELVLGIGDSTHEYRFVTAGWRPGQYQLVVNCETGGRNLFHEFQLKPIAQVMVFD